MPKDNQRRMRDLLLTICILGAAVLLSMGLSRIDNDNNPFAMAVFILAVALIARFTQGYFWGIAASLVSTFCVNYMFTIPFWEFNVSYTGYPLTMAAMLMVSVLISTLTTQIKQQEQLRYEMSREKMQASLLRAISHDIRTPLSTIMGAAGTLRDNELDEAQKTELLNSIEQDARWLVRLTENLLSVTRINDGNMTIKKEDEMLEEIIGSAVTKYRRMPGALPVECEHLPEPVMVPMDATLIEQVLINLFENVTHHGEGASRIRLSVHNAAEAVRITIEDDGAGIPVQLLNEISKGNLPPVRERGDETRNLGIGLSVCRTIINAHGGEIIFSAGKELGGAKVEFSLPDKEDEK